MKMMRRYFTMYFPLSLSMLSILFSVSAVADPLTIKLTFEPDIRNGQRIYETCAACHLPEGWGSSDGAYPQIAGQHKNVLIQQLLDIRSGVRENPTMYPFVQERTIGGYQSLADVVTYISMLPMSVRHKKGPWPRSTAEFKAECHGGKGEGNNDQLAPKLHGQHYPYVIRQIDYVKRGLRVVNDSMQTIIGQLSSDQLKQIINYVSYFPVPEGRKLWPAK
jgi:cytochrome c553